MLNVNSDVPHLVGRFRLIGKSYCLAHLPLQTQRDDYIQHCHSASLDKTILTNNLRKHWPMGLKHHMVALSIQ